MEYRAMCWRGMLKKRMVTWVGGGQFMAFISVVSVHIVKSVAPFGVFIPQE